MVWAVATECAKNSAITKVRKRIATFLWIPGQERFEPECFGLRLEGNVSVRLCERLLPLAADFVQRVSGGEGYGSLSLLANSYA